MSGPEPSAGRPRAVVIGAGIVGVSCGWYLREAGYAVTLIDERAPGQGTSYGNGSVIALDSIHPTQYPGVLWDVPRMLMDPDGYLMIRWRYLPQLAPWLIRFVLASRPKTWESARDAIVALNAQSLEAYRPLLKAPGADALLQRRGWLRLFMTKDGWQKAQKTAAAMQAYGLNTTLVGPDEIRQIEPAVTADALGAIHNSDVAHLGDPALFTARVADDLIRDGGELIRARAVGFELGERGPTAVRLDGGGILPIGPADRVVIAAGAWSKPLAAALGHKVPLESERGYHLMIPEARTLTRMPVISGDWGFVCTPLQHGMRIAGTVELASLGAAPNYSRLRPMLERARRMLPGLSDFTPDDESQWMGCRPSLPDSLPVISASPNHRNVLFAFGHQHLGVTLGPVTGRMIAAMATGRSLEIDPSPYRIDRF